MLILLTEICIRANVLRDWKCAYYPVSVHAEPEWSHRRRGKPLPADIIGTDQRNSQMIQTLYQSHLNRAAHVTEERPYPPLPVQAVSRSECLHLKFAEVAQEIL